MNSEVLEGRELHHFLKGNINTMSKIPCENCITLAVCKSKAKSHWENFSNYPTIYIFKVISVITDLAEKCNIVDEYITTSSKMSDDSWTVSVSHELSTRVIHYLIGENRDVQ